MGKGKMKELAKGALFIGTIGAVGFLIITIIPIVAILILYWQGLICSKLLEVIL
jgi:hypothetical protein